MKTRIIAIGGEPATGKSTIMKAVREKFPKRNQFSYGLVRGECFNRNIFFIGVFTGETFEGTDKLSMAVLPDFIKFIDIIKEDYTNAVIIFEGDRLFTQKLFNAHNSEIFIIKASEEEKQIRHINRGDTQSETFLKAKNTKIRNIEATNNCTILYNNNPEDIENIALYFEKIITNGNDNRIPNYT